MKPELILRIGAGLCFVGHGILALTAKAKFILLLGTFEIVGQNAILTLFFIGCLDIVIGLLIVFKPTKLVLIWAMFWTSLTICAWLIHGETIIDLMRRAPYFTVPFALFALMFNASTSNDFIGIRQDTSDSGQGETAISKIDLSKICMKLQDKQDGEGWTKIQCEEVAQEYRRYLKLKLLYPTEQIVPNLAIDTMWHYHILDTEAYESDCKAIYGKMLHHYPYFGMEGKADSANFVNSFDRTKLLYEKTFSSLMGGPNYLPSFQ